jgi:virginiamycin B lyase
MAMSKFNTGITNGSLDNDSLLTTTKQVAYNPIINKILEKNQTVDKYQVNKKEGESYQTNNDTIRKLQQEFCGLEARPHSNPYVTEYVLPQTCEMPLGIAVDSNAKKVWYVSTKKGVLGSYNLRENKFDQEHTIPEWKAREDPRSFSQVWDVKVDPNSRDVWFTDEKGNAIWRYIKSSQEFEIYKIPSKSESFGTTYPISIQFGANNIKNNDIKNNDDSANTIFFVGTYSQSLWYADTTRLKNGTSEGIYQIPIPVTNGFKGFDPVYITTGSVAVDNKRHVVWISVMAYSKKGQIFRYNIDTRSFDIFDLPKDLNSPLGLAVDKDSGNLWVTNPGTSIFYKFSPDDNKENNGSGSNHTNIVKFVTSETSPRIFSNNEDHLFGEEDKLVSNTNNITEMSKRTYTLPYWIKKSAGESSLWFNEWEGNKIARFDPTNMRLIEYWIPSQNRLWGVCSSSDAVNTSSTNNASTQQTCGISNILQFSIWPNNHNNNGKDKQIWFTEWSENKIGKVDADKHLTFSVDLFNSNKKGLTIKKGESAKIKIEVKSRSSSSHDLSSEDGNNDNNIRMIVSGTFTPTGDLGNSTGYFNKQSFSLEGNKKEDIIFTFSPSMGLKPGKYALMIGAENNAISYLKGIRVEIT